VQLATPKLFPFREIDLGLLYGDPSCLMTINHYRDIHIGLHVNVQLQHMLECDRPIFSLTFLILFSYRVSRQGFPDTLGLMTSSSDRSAQTLKPYVLPLIRI